ncbi:hypothetical protein ACQPZA_23660 [Pseudonocardia xinjiangensis]|uniref:hypothetical protein n=1 Tax=Pseudonocardia xinjiangensis TaxID=75289 RepID=UPI003D8A4613
MSQPIHRSRLVCYALRDVVDRVDVYHGLRGASGVSAPGAAYLAVEPLAARVESRESMKRE